MKVYIEKRFGKSITIDNSHLNVIYFIDQSIKIDITTFLAISVIDFIESYIDFIDGCQSSNSLISGIVRVTAVKCLSCLCSI